MGMRRVDWAVAVGRDLPAPRVSRASADSGVVSVLTMAEELSTYPDADTACRRAVEIARDRIGLERTSIFLEEGEMMRGTWGTGPRGETTDEHDLTFPVGTYEVEAHERAANGTGRWLLLDDAPQIAHLGAETLVLGYGWLAITPIRAAGKRLGVMFSDGALSRAPFSPHQHVRLAVLCSLFGPILERHRSRGGSKATVRVAGSVRSGVRRALALIEEDVTRTTEQLAEVIGTSPRQLGRVFRQDMGESIVAYRNRRRVERFFALTDGNPENLLQSALAAGFGSYAQFHRVFRSLVGATPSEYLTGQEAHDPSEVKRHDGTGRK